LPALSPDTPARPPACATSPRRRRILLVGGNPTDEHPLLAWLLRTNVRLNRARLYIANSKPIKLSARPKPRARSARTATNLAASLDAGRIRFQQGHPGRGIAGRHLRPGVSRRRPSKLVAWGLKRGNVRFAYLGDHSNSRGAADMGLFPDLLPGYVPGHRARRIRRVSLACPPRPAIRCRKCSRAGSRRRTRRAARRRRQSRFARQSSTPQPQEHLRHRAGSFPHRDRGAGRRRFPAASLYEKSGTVTNTFGDVQLVEKAADRAGVKPDFEILVRLAGGMGVDVSTLVPFGKGGTTADLGQSRGAQSGEADRHAVWLEANGLEPKLSPFDPLAVLDEIERLVPGYTLDRINLFAATMCTPSPASSRIRSRLRARPAPELVVPAHDTLFTSGTLGRYSRALKELEQHQANELGGIRGSQNPRRLSICSRRCLLTC
jgi:NADH-quinone oxidoreductase subunit G